MKRLLVIETCIECPSKEYDLGYCYCNAVEPRRTIDSLSIHVDLGFDMTEDIPEWCPLPRKDSKLLL